MTGKAMELQPDSEACGRVYGPREGKANAALTSEGWD